MSYYVLTDLSQNGISKISPGSEMKIFGKAG